MSGKLRPCFSTGWLQDSKRTIQVQILSERNLGKWESTSTTKKKLGGLLILVAAVVAAVVVAAAVVAAVAAVVAAAAAAAVVAVKRTGFTQITLTNTRETSTTLLKWTWIRSTG